MSHPALRIQATLFFVLFFTLAGSLPSLAKERRYQRSIEKYAAPQVQVIDQTGEKVDFEQLISSDGPVLLDFIYATCTTICPVLSAGFSNLQKKLGDEAKDVRLISVSIDPEHDRPEIMQTYLDKYRAKPGWDFITGNREDIDQVMHAFDAYVSNKMSHYPLMLMKTPNSDEWVRIYGLIGTRDLMKEFRQYYPATEGGK